MGYTKGQRGVLVVGWVLVLASTVFPPIRYDAIGQMAGGFAPCWRLFKITTDPAIWMLGSVDWSLLALLWCWIGLGVLAGLWLFRARPAG